MKSCGKEEHKCKRNRKAVGIATGQLSSKRNTIRPTRKKVRPRLRMTGREANISGIYDFWRLRECVWLRLNDSDNIGLK